MSNEKKKPRFTWEFEEKELNEKVKEAITRTRWKLRVFYVTSGDSGKSYWIQYLTGFIGDHPGELEILLCSCPDGLFKQPLCAIGLKDFWCKHSRAVYDTIIKGGTASFVKEFKIKKGVK